MLHPEYVGAAVGNTVMKLGSLKLVGVAFAGIALAACSTTVIQTGGPRPPQGVSSAAGTDFGFWDRDAEGAVDQDFRRFIAARYTGADPLVARKSLEADGFNCKDGNRPEAQPVPVLECERVYSEDDNVHSWGVKFWPNQSRPEAHYVRLHMRDPNLNYKDKTKNH